MRAVLADGLTQPQERFAAIVAAGELSQSDAYRAAYPRAQHWKASAVHVAASELAALPKVRGRIDALRHAAAEAASLRAAAVLAEIRSIAHSDISNVMNADGTVKLPHELDPATRAAVKSFEIDDMGRIKYSFWDKNQALDKAMRHLGLYEKDHLQAQGGLLALRDALQGCVVGPAPRAAAPDDDDPV